MILEVHELKYKNTGLVTKKFRGVEFKPGEVKSVKGYINDPQMVRIDSTMQSTQKSSQVDKTEKKAEVKQNG